VSASELETDVRWGLVRRILESQQFAKSARLQDFLLYVCRCALENRSDEISEHWIGERVFERATDYNPNEDNIVRSQARLLRQKLDAYFVSEGGGEPLLLRIPKGGYCPEFIERCEIASGEHAPAELPSAKHSEWRTPLVGGLLVAIVALVLVTAVLAWLLARPRESAQPHPPSSSASAVASLWSQLLGPNLTTTVIVPDHTFAMVQEASGQRIDLATYLRRGSKPDHQDLRQLERILPSFSLRRYTTVDGATTAVRVSQLAGQFNGRVIVRFARDMTLREVSPGHVVLIGRPLSNLWNEVFENRLNFRFYSDLERNVIICQNRSPRPGENAEYLPVDEGAKRTVYASIAFLPNLNNGGNVLIIAGNSSGSQEIAAEFATNEKLLSAFTSKVRQGNARLPYFEVLIRTITLDGVAQEPEVLAYRVPKF
jgi:hypothetical protein